MHGFAIVADTEIAVAQEAEDRSGAGIPTGPGQRRVAVGVFGVELGASVEKDLDGFFVAKGGCAVKWSFALGAAVAHEAPCFDAGAGGDVGIGSGGDEHAQDEIVIEAIGSAEGGVERGFTCVGFRVVYVRSLLEEEFAEPPVAVEAGRVEAEIFAEGSESGAVGEKKFDGADVPVVGAVSNERDAIMDCVGGAALGQIFKDCIGAAGSDFSKEGHREAS